MLEHLLLEHLLILVAALIVRYPLPPIALGLILHNLAVLGQDLCLVAQQLHIVQEDQIRLPIEHMTPPVSVSFHSLTYHFINLHFFLIIYSFIFTGQSTCCNCRRKQVDASDERYNLVFHVVSSKDLRRKSGFSLLSKTKAEGSQKDHNLCGECFEVCVKKSNDFKHAWPAFLWNILCNGHTTKFGGTISSTNYIRVKNYGRSFPIP